MFVNKLLWLCFCFVAFILFCCVPLQISAHNETVDWFAPVTPLVSKIHDYSVKPGPFVSNFDCHEFMLGTARQCGMDTSLGTLVPSGGLVVDGKDYKLTGYGGFGWLIPVPHSALVLDTRPGAINGEYIAVHRSLERKDLAFKTYWGWPPTQQYEVTKPFDYWLTDSNNNRIEANPQLLAFSSNGYWMVFDVPHGGIFKVNMATMDIFPVGPSVEGNLDFGLANGSITISNDGRYVASGNGTDLTLYDTSSCTHKGYTGGPVNLQGCKYRDLWQGQYALTSQTTDMGIQSQITTGSVYGNLRFVDDGNLRFDARYDFVSYTDYKVAEYVVSAQGADTHKLGLLALGDSYISGEGEFDYLPGTDDSKINLCHLSPKSYPYLLGGSSFNDYHSVACSGAVSEDVNDYHDEYTGQVKDGIPQKSRDKDSILARFSPGYIYQNAFTQTYQPEALLLSIGGNDIEFSKIIKSCVAGLSTDSTCYGTREERVELLNSINDAFYKLANTYEDIQKASPSTRIYVVGYPQIIKPDGKCGDNVRLNQAETEFAAQLITRLDSVIARAATKAGVFYVDTEHALDGYRLCEAKGGVSAVNGLTTGGDTGLQIKGFQLKLLGNESYHPTVLGHQLLANAIAEQTHNLTAAMPAPQPLGGPLLNSNDPFLDVPPTGRSVFARFADDGMTSADYIVKGVATKVNLNGLKDNLATNLLFSVVLHSTPTDLGTATTDGNGDLTTNITIPTTVPAGMHTLHVVGKDFAGRLVDIQKIVYVVSSDGPAYDGFCQIVPDSGVDADKDGIDDACDPVIGLPPESPVEVSSSSTDTGQYPVEELPKGQDSKEWSSPAAISILQPAPTPQRAIASLKTIEVESSAPSLNGVVDPGADTPASGAPAVLGTHTQKQSSPPKGQSTNGWVSWIVAVAVVLAGALWLGKRRA